MNAPVALAPRVMLARSFSLAEFEFSHEAQRLGIDNRVPRELLPAARATCEMLQRIRDHLSAHFKRDCPLILSSGYRCLELNRRVGSNDNSDHPKALAADWRTMAWTGRPIDICHILAPLVDALNIGQLINEYPSADGGWVHTSQRTPNKIVNRVITITHAGTRAGIQEAWS